MLPKSPAEREKVTDERIHNPFSTFIFYDIQCCVIVERESVAWKNHFITINMLNNRHRCRCCLLSCTQEGEMEKPSQTRFVFSDCGGKKIEEGEIFVCTKIDDRRQRDEMMRRRWQNYVFELSLKLTFIGFISKESCSSSPSLLLHHLRLLVVIFDSTPKKRDKHNNS